MTMVLEYLSRIPALMIAVVLHEYIKALCSTRLGDPVPGNKGRLTMNPKKHIDPLGAICIFIWGYGWGNPVQTSPMYYKDRRKGTIMTYVLPSAANLFIGVAFAVAVKLAAAGELPFAVASNGVIRTVYFTLIKCLAYIARYNVAMALFNIVPIFPLDGYKVLSQFLRATTMIKLQQSEKILQILLMFAIVLGFAGRLFDPFVSLITGGLAL